MSLVAVREGSEVPSDILIRQTLPKTISAAANENSPTLRRNRRSFGLMTESDRSDACLVVAAELLLFQPVLTRGFDFVCQFEFRSSREILNVVVQISG